jgi:hypothetical protein
MTRYDVSRARPMDTDGMLARDSQEDADTLC